MTPEKEHKDHNGNCPVTREGCVPFARFEGGIREKMKTLNDKVDEALDEFKHMGINVRSAIILLAINLLVVIANLITRLAHLNIKELF